MTGERARPPAPGFEPFFLRYEPLVRRYLFTRGARHDVLDEAAQATMEEALRSWARLSAHPNPQAWLFKVAGQRYDTVRKEHLRLGERTDPADFDRLPPDDAGLSCDDRLDLVRRIDELPEQQREAVMLRCLFDLPYDQVAHVMGVRASSARAHVSRALSRLSQMYAEEEGGAA
ncbi:RNA polymerase sigma factor [Streptomyces sp. NPDC047014]|uniref:RNA polymerase sigma factor n=1 Tax=Streptomyces sp. NPDC047014 TaxID=3155736 RepID=UPI0033C4A676